MSTRTIIVMTALATGFFMVALGSVAPVSALAAVIGTGVAFAAALSLRAPRSRPAPVRFGRRNLRM